MDTIQNQHTQCQCTSDSCGAQDPKTLTPDGHSYSHGKHPCGRCVSEGTKKITFAFYTLVATALLCDACQERRGLVQ